MDRYMIRNIVQIETKTGLKEFELFQGDITNLPFDVDLICVSAFKNDYEPTLTSIIGQFLQKGVDIEYLSKVPKLDFRDSLSIWVSESLKNEKNKNIICVEITGANILFSKTIQNLFSVISILEIQGEQNKTIAIPLLGAGDQQIDSKIIIPQLIDISLEFLKYSRHLDKIYFVVYSDDNAKEFNTVMNNSLGRNKLQTSKGELASILKNDLISSINKVLEGELNNTILNDLKRVVNSDFRSFEFGAISRKAIECILDDINPDSKKQFELYKKIDALNAKGVAL